jgi:hypothetical protein
LASAVLHGAAACGDFGLRVPYSSTSPSCPRTLVGIPADSGSKKAGHAGAPIKARLSDALETARVFLLRCTYRVVTHDEAVILSLPGLS